MSLPSKSKTPVAGRTLVLTTHAMGAGGRAVAKLDGFTWLVDRALPDEKVEAVVERSFAGHGEARLARVLEPSLQRREPPCPLFDQCGGCDWQQAQEAAQLEWKRQTAQEQLSRLGGVAAPDGWPIHPSPKPLRYRDRLDFSVAPGPVPRPAFFPWRGGIPLAVEDCPLAPAGLTQAASGLLSFLKPAQARQVARLRAQRVWRPEGEGVALYLDLEGKPAPRWLEEERDKLSAHLIRSMEQRSLPPVVSLSFGLAGQEKKAARAVWGGPWLVKQVGGRRYQLPLDGFFQVNPDQAGALAAQVALLAGRPTGEAPLFDLFCGSGLFSLPLAAAGWKVVGAELHAGSVEGARRQAKEDGLAGAAFGTAHLDRPGALAALAGHHGAPQLVVADPPRRGLAAPLLAELLALAPQRIIYVSCDGATFARDAGRLAAHYHLKELSGFDLFPQTHHLELCGLFERQ